MRNPAAYGWFKSKLDAFVRLGVKGYKIDRGEEREQPDSVQNRNVRLFEQMAHEGLTARAGNDAFVFARNVNDTSRRYSAVWNGDTVSDFDGLRYSIMGGLRSGIINFPMWGSDTGGYKGAPTKETFARWLEFSAYSPMMEVLIGGRRTPWYDYDRELLTIAADQARTHHDLIPYSRSSMYQATRTGTPVLRALLLEHPQDAKAASVTDEYMYGCELLVAPVVAPGARSRSVYLPAGRWLDYNDRRTVHSGPTTVAAAAPLRTTPVYVREGAIVPRGDVIKSNNGWAPHWKPSLRIEMFPSSRTSNTFGYYTGERVEAIRVDPAGDDIEISLEDLGAPGKLEIYVRDVREVIRNGTPLRHGIDYHFDRSRRQLTVPYSGATDIVLRQTASVFGR